MKQLKYVLIMLLALVMILSCVAPVFAADCAHAHTEVRNAVAAGCETEGYSGDTYCKDCGALLAKGAVIPATGHHYDSGVVSKPATCTEDGVRIYLCKDCGSTYTTVIKASGHLFGEWVVVTPATATVKGEESRTCTYCGLVETREIKPLSYAKCYAKHFTDCTEKWYHEAVDYCVDAGLMDGVSTKLFAPKGAMTRGMIVTVLYRMAGKPEITALSSFKDVDKDAWYAEPIAWAQDTGIVLGYSADQFGPNDYVTREQIATILWRFEGRPEGKDANMDKFKDTKKISTYAENAMKWAVGEGILSGDNLMLKPKDNATRAEFACMIMRYKGGSFLCETMKDWEKEEEDDYKDVDGTYRLVTINGKSVKKYLIEKYGDEEHAKEYLEYYELTRYEDILVLNLKKDGKFTASYLDEDYNGTWKVSSGKLTLTVRVAYEKDENMVLNYNKGEITFEVDGEEWLLAR
ncbi:MAG: S-layer homology domain-containing protein [Oscillospiraceae bacterium]|nr:S-layer homology domain-containing protein [Oscillospiraceae bacterium]